MLGVQVKAIETHICMFLPPYFVFFCLHKQRLNVRIDGRNVGYCQAAMSLSKSPRRWSLLSSTARTNISRSSYRNNQTHVREEKPARYDSCPADTAGLSLGSKTLKPKNIWKNI
jgi:hypothetical protein